MEEVEEGEKVEEVEEVKEVEEVEEVEGVEMVEVAMALCYRSRLISQISKIDRSGEFGGQTNDGRDKDKG